MIDYQDSFKAYLPYAAPLFVFLYPVLKLGYQKSITIVWMINIFALLHVWALLFFLNFGVMAFFIVITCHAMLFILNGRARSDAVRKP